MRWAGFWWWCSERSKWIKFCVAHSMLMGPYGITLEKDWNLFFDRAAALWRIQSIHCSTLLRRILHQWILQKHSTQCFVWFCTSGFCKYRTGTASLDFAPVDFANTQHTLLRWILHRFLFAPSCGNHTHCISPLFWFGHTRYIGASNITILVNIVDQTLAAKADMFQEDS